MMTATRTMNRHNLQSALGVRGWILKAMAIMRELGPYAAIELVLPGGSLIAVLLWLYRRSRLTGQN